MRLTLREPRALLANLLKPKTPPLIGLDISSSSVKMVELVDAGKAGPRIERYAIEPLPKEAVVDGNIANLEATAAVVRSCHQRLSSRTRNVSLALPAAAVITKKITCSAALSEQALEAEVEGEANQYIPFALEEVNLDFQVIGPTASGEDVEVLIAASRKEKVEDRMAVAEAAGLRGLVMDVESYAMQAAFDLIRPRLPSQGWGQNIAMVDIGATMMHVNVLRDGQSVYAREQAFGGNQLNQEINRHYGLSPEEAEAAKKTGSLPASYESEVLRPFMDNLAMEVQRALHFFFSSTQYNKVDQIILAGGCAILPGLDDLIAARTRVPTMVANPFANMQISPSIQLKRLIADAPALMIACGLAMRQFDA
jgi:type IV pilus assembly protein PilM